MTVLEMMRELLRYPPEAEITFSARTNGGELIAEPDEVQLGEDMVIAKVPEQCHKMYLDLIDKGPDECDPVIIRIVEAN